VQQGSAAKPLSSSSSTEVSKAKSDSEVKSEKPEVKPNGTQEKDEKSPLVGAAVVEGVDSSVQVILLLFFAFLFSVSVYRNLVYRIVKTGTVKSTQQLSLNCL
jgi:hypothetical protein